MPARSRSPATSPPGCPCPLRPTARIASAPVDRAPTLYGRRRQRQSSTPGDRCPVVLVGIEGVAGHQAGVLVEERDPVGDRQVPAKLREAAEHALGHFAAVAPPAHLALGQPASGWRHRDEVALIQERYAAPYDLRLIVPPDV